MESHGYEARSHSAQSKTASGQNWMVGRPGNEAKVIGSFPGHVGTRLLGDYSFVYVLLCPDR